jgi:hypothetical protein
MPASDSMRVATLAATILERNLPPVVATIATQGGSVVHPALWFRAESVHPAAWSLVDRAPGLVPLWSCGIESAFVDADRTFPVWSAEHDQPRARFRDFAGLVQCLLSDLWADDETEEDRRAVAELLLPPRQVGAALRVRRR